MHKRTRTQAAYDLLHDAKLRWGWLYSHTSDSGYWFTGQPRASRNTTLVWDSREVNFGSRFYGTGAWIDKGKLTDAIRAGVIFAFVHDGFPLQPCHSVERWNSRQLKAFRAWLTAKEVLELCP